MFATETQPTHPQPVEAPLDASQSLADIVREETDHGRLIVRFLIDLMQGSLENAKPCHRLDAARQLLNLGWAPAHACIAANSSQVRRSRAGGDLAPVSPLVLSLSKDHSDLAALIRGETGNGRAAVRFLVDVMQGNLQGFKPHHRLSAAMELLHRGFDSPAPETEPEDEVSPRHRDPDGIYYRDCDGNWQRDYTRSQVPDYSSYSEADPPVNDLDHHDDFNRFRQDYGPFHFESYDEDDFQLDNCGRYALDHIFGGDDAISAAKHAVKEYEEQAGSLALDSGCHSPCSSVEWPPLPEDAPLPEAIYGYPVLLYMCASEESARVAAHAAYQHFQKLRAFNSQARGYPNIPPRPSAQSAPRDVSQVSASARPPPPEPAPVGQRILLGSSRIGGLDSLHADLFR